jgi:hypothetical protein
VARVRRGSADDGSIPKRAQAGRRIAMPKYINADALTAELNDMDGMKHKEKEN